VFDLHVQISVFQFEDERIPVFQQHAMKTYGKMEVQIHLFLTSALLEIEWSGLPLEKNPTYPWIYSKQNALSYYFIKKVTSVILEHNNLWFSEQNEANNPSKPRRYEKAERSLAF
jgi:hypothetical protein